jgi:GT2 family glycosyltransferase
MEKDPRAGVCYTNSVYFDENGIILASYASFRHAYSGSVFDPLFVENFILTPAVMVRRDCLENVGGFNPEYLNAQDYDLWIRLARHNRFIYLDEILVRCRYRKDSLSKNYDRLYASDFRISRQLLEEDPEYFRKRSGMVRTRFGSLHFRYAWRLFQDRRFEEARREFGRSLRYRAMNVRGYGYWVATFLPNFLIEGIRRFKQAWLSSKKC